MQIKESVASVASGAMGTDEKVALAKAAYRFAQQIQTIVDSTVYACRQLLDGTFTASLIIGSRADNTLITLGIDLSASNPELNIPTNNFDLRLSSLNFAGVTGLSLASLNDVSASNLGMFDFSVIQTTLTSISIALTNVSKVASYLGGIANRLTSQEDALKSQITNYNAAISRIEDADVAKEQLELIRAQFLQQASIISLAQANQTPQTFPKLLRG